MIWAILIFFAGLGIFLFVRGFKDSIDQEIQERKDRGRGLWP